jgi:hypothetical protein
MTQACIFTVVEKFLEVLAKCIDCWGAETKIEHSFSLPIAISPKYVLSIILGMCTLG